MTIGPGVYDAEATLVMESTHARRGVIVIVLDGDRGSGFAVQTTIGMTLHLPKILRDMADQLDPDVGELNERKAEDLA
jgi:hypothetical protein